MYNDDTYYEERDVTQEEEIEIWEARKKELLRRAGIPTDLLGKDITIYFLKSGSEDGKDYFIIHDSIETKIQGSYFDSKDITLILPHGIKVLGSRISSIKRNVFEENESWLALIEQQYVIRNHNDDLFQEPEDTEENCCLDQDTISWSEDEIKTVDNIETPVTVYFK